MQSILKTADDKLKELLQQEILQMSSFALSGEIVERILYFHLGKRGDGVEKDLLKRALKELVDAGFLKKDSRFCENNRMQISNLYTLMFQEEAPTPDNDNNHDHRDFIEPAEQSTPTGEY